MTCPIECNCICHDTGGSGAHEGQPCPGKNAEAVQLRVVSPTSSWLRETGGQSEAIQSPASAIDATPMCPIHIELCLWSEDAPVPERFGYDRETALNDGIWWCPADGCVFQVESVGPEWVVGGELHAE